MEFISLSRFTEYWFLSSIKGGRRWKEEVGIFSVVEISKIKEKDYE